MLIVVAAFFRYLTDFHVGVHQKLFGCLDTLFRKQLFERLTGILFQKCTYVVRADGNLGADRDKGQIRIGKFLVDDADRTVAEKPDAEP